MIDEVIDVHIHLEKAEKTIIDQNLHIATRNLHSHCSWWRCLMLKSVNSVK